MHRRRLQVISRGIAKCDASAERRSVERYPFFFHFLQMTAVPVREVRESST